MDAVPPADSSVSERGRDERFSDTDGSPDDGVVRVLDEAETRWLGQTEPAHHCGMKVTVG